MKETEQTLLDQIKDQVAKTRGDHTDHLRGEGRCEARKDQYGNPVFDAPEEEAEYRKKTEEMANRILAKNPFRKPVSAPSESQEEVNVVLSDLTSFQNTLHESGFVTFRNLRGDIISVKGMIQHITKLLTRKPE